MRIALIGGAGFIGHHLASHLSAAKHDVLVIDPLLVNNFYSLFRSKEPNAALYLDMIEQRLQLMHAAGVRHVTADARDYHLLSKVCRAFEPEKIVHLAAVAHIDRANKSPFDTLDHSLRTLENALDVARALDVQQFVYFSSSTVYGDFESDSVSEIVPCHPKGIYATTKLAGELIARAYAEVKKVPTTIVRPSALYGPRCVSGRVTQRWIENAYFGTPSFIEGDGSGRVDFTYITDLVAGLEAVLTDPAAIGETFNMTAGAGRSLAELRDIILRHFPDARFTSVTPDRARPKRGTLDCRLAHVLLDYEPKWPLELGMAEYVRWFKSFIGERHGQGRKRTDEGNAKNGESHARVEIGIPSVRVLERSESQE